MTISEDVNSSKVNTLNNESENTDIVESSSNVSVSETKVETKPPIKYPETRDGMDISWIPHESVRGLLRWFIKDNFLNWFKARRLMLKHEAQSREGRYVKVISGDYLFNECLNDIYLGYILDIRTRVYNFVESMYLDIAIDGSKIKTVKCQLGLKEDVVANSIKEHFGGVFAVEDLLYAPVVLQVHNKTDAEGNVVFSKIQQFYFISNGYVKFIDKVTREITGNRLG